MSQGKALEVINVAQKSVNMTNFFREMANPDEDYAILALNSLQELLEQYHEVKVPKGGEKMFINKFSEKMTNKNPFVTNAVFKVLSLLIKYFDVAHVPLVLENLLSDAFSVEFKGDSVMQQILTIIKDNLSQASSFSDERNACIFKVLFTNQKNQLTIYKDENLVFLLELFATIYQYLGYRVSKEDNKFVIEKLMWLFEQNIDNSTTTAALIYLLQAWSQFATEELVAQVIDHIKKDNVKDTIIPFNVIFALTLKVVKLLKPYLDDIIPLLINIVNETSEFLQENEATDDVITKCSNAIIALSKIVEFFPEVCLEKQDEIFSVAFSFLSYDCDTILNAAKEEEEEEAADDDEFGDDDEEGLVDEDLEVIGEIDDATGISTWKLRKAAITLCTSLLHEYPDEFISYFLGQYEDFNTIIQDSDIGVQIDAYEIITKIFNKFTTAISPEIFDLFISTICTKVTTEQKSIAAALSALISIIKVTGGIKEEYALTLIGNLSSSITAQAAKPLFNISQEILKFNQSEKMVNAISNLLINVASLPPLYIVTAVEIAASIYQASKTATKNIIELNKFVLESAKSGLECIAAALPTVAVFIVSYKGAETAAESIELIKSSIAKPMVRKSLLGALTIIASTKDSCDLIKPFANELGEFLFASLKGNDVTVQFRGLWVAKLFLEQGILNNALLEKVLLAVVDIIVTGDNRSRSLALDIINECKNAKAIEQAQQKLREALNNQVEKNFIASAVNFVKANISQELIESLIEVGEQEIKQGERGEKAAITTADVIGLSIAGTEFENSVKLAQSIFTTLVTGALGIVSDISKKQDIVDKIFEDATTYDDRATFAAASEAVGRASVGSQSILNRLIILSDKDDAHIPTWIAAYHALASVSVGKLNAKQLAPIAKYLLECRGGAQNTKTCAEALSYIAQADNAFIAELFKDATPLSIYALAILASRSSEELVATFIKSALSIIDTKNPVISSYSVSILISALKFPALVDQVAEGADKIISCIKFNEAHILVEDMGLSKTETDIGKTLRINAITAAILLGKKLPIAEAVDATIASLKDPVPEVIAKALALLSTLAEVDLDAVEANEEQIVNGLLEVEKSAKKQEMQTVLEAPLCAALGSLTARGIGSAPFLELASRYSSDANYQKALKKSDQVEVAATESSASSLARFLSHYNKDAAGIFVE